MFVTNLSIVHDFETTLISCEIQIYFKIIFSTTVLWLKYFLAAQLSVFSFFYPHHRVDNRVKHMTLGHSKLDEFFLDKELEASANPVQTQTVNLAQLVRKSKKWIANKKKPKMLDPVFMSTIIEKTRNNLMFIFILKLLMKKLWKM